MSYRIPESQLIGGPDWIGTLRFDIEAKAADGVQTHDPEQNLSLIRSLLQDRFRLKAHRETREGAVFSLVVGKNGSKLKEAVDNGAPRSGGARGGPAFITCMSGRAKSIREVLKGVGTK
jgi:uncharacterized protein (TIGR03435 family)